MAYVFQRAFKPLFIYSFIEGTAAPSFTQIGTIDSLHAPLADRLLPGLKGLMALNTMYTSATFGVQKVPRTWYIYYLVHLDKQLY